MSIRVGDPVFLRGGIQPGYVKQKDKEKLTLTVTSEGVDEHARHGHIKGLEPAERKKFNADMDEVQTLRDPAAKVQLLQTKIDQYEKLGHLEDIRISEYLKGEMAHIMFTNSISPREYRLKDLTLINE